MKIRIKGNFVRYRLSRPDVEKFSKEGYLEESTEFISNTFVYALKAKPGITDMEADYLGNRMTIYFPDSEKETWFHSERVGYKNFVDLPGGKQLGLLLEKDFACIDHTEEDQSDNYPNPSKIC